MRHRSAEVDSERDKLDCRRPRCELRRSTAVVCHSDRQALSAARFRRAGLSATADTCCVYMDSGYYGTV